MERVRASWRTGIFLYSFLFMSVPSNAIFVDISEAHCLLRILLSTIKGTIRASYIAGGSKTSTDTSGRTKRGTQTKRE